MLLVFAIPLVCWALLARSARFGARVGAVLAGCALVEIAAAKEWLFPQARITLITAISVLTIAILVWGVVHEFRQNAAGVGLISRQIVGVALTGVYCVAGGLVCLIVIIVGGPARGAEPSSSVVPVGPGIVVVSDTASCGQAGNSCLREITVRDELGRPSGQFTDAVLSDLEHQHGWRFGSDGMACRPAGGWALDRQRACAWLDDLTKAPLVGIQVETDIGTGMILSGLQS